MFYFHPVQVYIFPFTWLLIDSETLSTICGYMWIRRATCVYHSLSLSSAASSSMLNPFFILNFQIRLFADVDCCFVRFSVLRVTDKLNVNSINVVWVCECWCERLRCTVRARVRVCVVWLKSNDEQIFPRNRNELNIWPHILCKFSRTIRQSNSFSSSTLYVQWMYILDHVPFTFRMYLHNSRIRIAWFSHAQ